MAESDKRARVLLLAPTRGYQLDDMEQAAKAAGIELVLGTDRCHVLAEVWPEGALALDFRDLESALESICQSARERSLDGVLGTDEVTAVLAEETRARLGIGAASTVGAAAIAGNKLAFRRAMSAAGLIQPGFTTVPRHATLAQARRAMERADIDYPVVIKPLHLSASRGVMRADDDHELETRLARLAALLRDPETEAKDPEAAARIVIERYIPGREVAFEGLLASRARVETMITLEIFDKPDPLEGPFFAETIYLAPTREDPDTVRAIEGAVADAAHAIGLSYGPVHAELRIPESGPPVVIELAARAIGGLCHRTLRFASGASLAELLLRHAAGQDVAALVASSKERAHGVYMIPVDQPGVLRAIEGVDRALAVPGIRDIAVTARIGDTLVPVPEGATYMGFIFAEVEDAEGTARDAVLAALRQARAHVRFRSAPLL